MPNTWWSEHKGLVIGASSGVCLGIVYLFFGFWNMIVFLLIAMICSIIGYQFDHRSNHIFFRDFWQQLKSRRNR
jgi:uncharacterized membrane protein